MAKIDKWALVVKVVVWSTILALGVGLVRFEQVNFITTYESLAALFGNGSWIGILTWGVVLTDIAALARIFTPETEGGKESNIVKSLWTVWLTVSFFDAGFNWYFASLEMESTKIRVPVALHGFEWVLPIIVAVIIWGVQFGLLYFFGLLLDNALHDKRKSTATSASSNNSYSNKNGSNQHKVPTAASFGLPPIQRPVPGVNMSKPKYN
jgi:hypothetical protein